jgi:hypothetical protein
MIRSASVAVAVIVGALTQTVVGCFLAPSTSAPPVPPPPEVVQPVVRVTATPAYRLVIEPRLGDAPSRLVVLYARIEVTEGDVLYFDPAALRLVLPGGRKGKIYDAPRAAVLLQRTDLAPWEPAHMAGSGQSSARLTQESRTRLKDQVNGSLMTAGEFGSDRTLTGYLVADTGAALQSFDQVTLEVFATRVKDALPVHGTYTFAAHKPPVP